ncbi:MAG: trigger factor [Clostridiales bacterium]
MKVNAEKLEGNKAKLTIEVAPETFEKSMDKAFRQVVKKISIPGFRKGKAPRHVVERMYGREILLEDAINDAVPEAFSQALDEIGSEYECIVYPKYEIVSSEKGQGLIFTATYDLKPEIKLGAYKGMELEKISEAAEEGAVEKQLKAMQERFARLEKTDGPAVVGDVCTIDFLGKVDDIPFEGGAGQNHPLELGSGSFIPGFEEQLVGAKVGDEVAVNVTFPEDYRATELAGKAAVFDVAVKEIQHKIFSEMDDEFAKDVSEFETLEELKKDLEEKLNKEAKEKAQADLENKAVEKAVEEADPELPESMLAMRQDQLLENFARQIRRQGIELEQYMELTGMKLEDIRENFKERAQKELQTELVLEAVAKAEGVVISDEDLEDEYKRLADQTGRPAEEIKEIYGGNKTMVESLKFNLMMNKAIKVLTDNAKIK